MNQLVNQTDKADQAFNTAADALNQGKAIQQIQTQYATAVAVQKPRDLMVVEKSCMKEAALAGEVCFYGWGSGQNRVEGPSVDCAMIAARNWGNAAVEMKPVVQTHDAYIMEAAFIDLETGFTYSRQFRQAKNSIIHGNMDAARKDDVRFQIGQSKTQRNVILKAVPKWLIDKMIGEAKRGVREKLDSYIKSKGIESARKLALDALVKHGVKLENIELKYDKKYGAWDREMLVILKGDIRALADGVESADALFPGPKEETKASEQTSGLSDKEMKPGDDSTHQGYDHSPEKESTKTDEPDNTEQENLGF